MSTINLLLAEDDETLGYLLKEYLMMHGFNVDWTTNGEEAWKQFVLNSYDIALLDVMMPFKDGFSLLSDIKTKDVNFPVILLTAKGLKIDKLKGFKFGADDYIVKPVDEEEMVARINAILRRTGKYVSVPAAVFTIGKYQFDYETQKLSYENETIYLSQREAQLLREFCLNKNKLIERYSMLKQFWGRNDYFARKSMDVFIYKLRNYLSQDENIEIKNIHGKGYVMSEK
ncbi:MAG: response regulator transcription factor [Pseudomonadota bacterium]|jgi:DNA-binding response OmpR family regulator